MSDETPPYEVEEANGAFRVLDRLGLTLVQCRDRPTAEHYVALLGAAYRSGYRAGYRAGKSQAEPAPSM